MDTERFDGLLRSLSSGASRRGVLVALTGGLLAALPIAHGEGDAEARNGNRPSRKRHKKKHHRKGKNKKAQHAAPPPPPPPPPDPITRVDATCPGQGGDGFLLGGNQRQAQTFTALASGQLVRADLLLSHNADPADYTLRLSPVDGAGVPTNAVLAEASVAAASLPVGDAPVTFTFTNAAAVVAGTPYALVLSRSGSTDLRWFTRDGNPCTGRVFVSPDQATPFVPSEDGRDAIFTTFVRS